MHKYFAIFKISFIQAIRNYHATLGMSVFLIACLLVLSQLFTIATQKTGIGYIMPDKLIWYIALNEWVLLSLPRIQYNIEEDLRSDRLAYLLPRPISYLGAIYAEAAGAFCFNLIALGFVAFLFTWGYVQLFPFDLIQFCLSIILGLISGLIGIIFLMLIGVSAFWMKEVRSFSWVWDKFLFVLGGLIIPLSIYPEWVQAIANSTPFPLILGARSALVLQFEYLRFFAILLYLLIWGAIGLISLAVLYRKGLHLLNTGTT